MSSYDATPMEWGKWLAELEGYANAATPGPWGIHEPMQPAGARPRRAAVQPPQLFVQAENRLGGAYELMSVADATFCAVARTAVPVLLGEVRTLHAERTRWLQRTAEEAGTEPYHIVKHNQLQDRIEQLEALCKTQVDEIAGLRDQLAASDCAYGGAYAEAKDEIARLNGIIKDMERENRSW